MRDYTSVILSCSVCHDGLSCERRAFRHSPTLPTRRTHDSMRLGVRRWELTSRAGGIMATDLVSQTDAVLQASLDMLFIEHAEAADACDLQAQAEAHFGIAAIMAEQSRRLDTWIELQRAAHA